PPRKPRRRNHRPPPPAQRRPLREHRLRKHQRRVAHHARRARRCRRREITRRHFHRARRLAAGKILRPQRAPLDSRQRFPRGPRLARRGDTIVIAGGEAGELLGYDLRARLALTFAGSISSQLNGLLPLAGSPDRFLVLRNNAPGLGLLDFAAAGPREAETRRLDLGAPATLGALRFNRLRQLADADLALALKASSGSDDLEGWSAWTPLATTGDGWRAENLRARYVKLRVKLAPAAGAAAPSSRDFAPELDKASLYTLPQNRRPLLGDFRVITPNYGVIPAVDQPPPANVALSQVLQSGPRDDDAKRRETLLRSQIVPAPGNQIILWQVTDPDGDALAFNFSIRRDGTADWLDLAVGTRDSFVQFDTAHLPDGVYFTRLVATELGPRPPADRLTATFETDDLLVDHTPPEILEATARRDGDRLLVTLRGRDARSLLEGIEATFNNGVHEALEQPADGIRDSREETFTLDLPAAKFANATSVEVTLADAAGNTATRRIALPK
ncbi:MAG: hypothetical protein RLZZ15_2729, partial [Verrucomicrobiota bacterium]